MVNKTESYWKWFIFSKGNNNTIQEVYFQMGVAIGIYAIKFIEFKLINNFSCEFKNGWR